MNFNSIEGKKALFSYGYLGFLIFPRKIWTHLFEIATLENFSDCSYGHINSNSIGLTYRLVNIRTFRVFLILVLKYVTYFPKI
jgi:hypothetical protein